MMNDMELVSCWSYLWALLRKRGIHCPAFLLIPGWRDDFYYWIDENGERQTRYVRSRILRLFGVGDNGDAPEPGTAPTPNTSAAPTTPAASTTPRRKVRRWVLKTVLSWIVDELFGGGWF